MTRYLTPKILGSVLLTLLLGVISSGLWDLLFKPGLTEFGRNILTVITLGSETIRDSAYSSAALNPSPLPSLIVVILLSYSPLFVASAMIGASFGRRAAGKTFDKSENEASGDPKMLAEILEVKKRELTRYRNMFTWGVVLVVGAMTITVGSVINQSVAIWRVFHADLAICGPYISDKEEKQLVARFTSVSTRKDYLAIENDLETIARKNGVKLMQVQLW